MPHRTNDDGSHRKVHKSSRKNKNLSSDEGSHKHSKHKDTKSSRYDSDGHQKRKHDKKHDKRRRSISPVKKSRKEETKHSPSNNAHLTDHTESKKHKSHKEHQKNKHDKPSTSKKHESKILNSEEYTIQTHISSPEVYLPHSDIDSEQKLRLKLLEKRENASKTNTIEIDNNDNENSEIDSQDETRDETKEIDKTEGESDEKNDDTIDEVMENSENDDHNNSYDQIDYVKSKFESLSQNGSDGGDGGDGDDDDDEDEDEDDDDDDDDNRSRSNQGSSCRSSVSFGSSISSSRNPRYKRKSSNNFRGLELEFSPVDKPEPEPEQIVDHRPFYYPAIQGCRAVEEFTCLNRIEEGSYGVVFRAKDLKSNEIVALKRLKMEKEKDGFPITSLREINTLMKAKHENIVTVREVVVGSNMDKIYLVMDFVEHDLKSLMTSMVKPFEICEVKCLMVQLLSAVAHLHDNWILHRDLKTSNLLLSHKGILKVADFGLAREYGSPLKHYTKVVVTLWYRAPELLLGTRIYSTPIDMWSVGCIFGELLLMTALFPGKSEVDQINLLFSILGTPNEKIWPGYKELPNVKRYEFAKYEFNKLSRKFGNSLTDCGMELLNKCLAFCPARRITAEEALKHSYFIENPRPLSPEMFPTRPAKSEGGLVMAQQRGSKFAPVPPGGLVAQGIGAVPYHPILMHHHHYSPKPPSGGQGLKNLDDDKFIFR